MTKPLTPAGCDLRDFPHTPLFRSRLFGSSFHAHANDSEWRAGVTLWLKSWDQVPAGSLPNDDVDLCRLAELGKDLKSWKKVRAGALHGWIVCTDGRMYHPVVAEGVRTAIDAKSAQRLKTAKARIAALEKHLAKANKDNDADSVQRLSEEIAKIQQSLLKPTPSDPTESVTDSVTDPVAESKRREVEGKEKGTTSSEANASGGKPPALISAADPPSPPSPPSPPEPPAPPPPPPPFLAPPPSARDLVFALGVPLLTAAGVKESNARSFLALRSKTHTDEALAVALEECATEKPIQPIPWIEQRLGSTGKRSAAHSGFATKNYREGVTADGSLA